MPKGDVDTFHQEGGWFNRVQGEVNTFSGPHETKEEAVAVGRETARARQAEHIIRREDGTIGERNSYGNDPRDVRG
ncbi:DUF2188 domain-containing protein [Zhihengliuella sp. ISTPL4]|uniref:DUF2188 domain-containing protein n=1 Tax=Zhihengliuella sp. ISTPL4 TaxID=2058657 RepID=UPI000C7C3B08|nr:DUF2188 domain-containing protein [Zhihengliuella sp. ISTPL4]